MHNVQCTIYLAVNLLTLTCVKLSGLENVFDERSIQLFYYFFRQNIEWYLWYAHFVKGKGDNKYGVVCCIFSWFDQWSGKHFHFATFISDDGWKKFQPTIYRCQFNKFDCTSILFTKWSTQWNDKISTDWYLIAIKLRTLPHPFK